MPEVFISRQPLVNRQSKIIATRLTLHSDGRASTVDAAQALSAVSTVGGMLGGGAEGYSINASQAGGTAEDLAAAASEEASEEERRRRRGSQSNIRTSQLGLLSEGQTAASVLLG